MRARGIFSNSNRDSGTPRMALLSNGCTDRESSGKNDLLRGTDDADIIVVDGGTDDADIMAVDGDTDDADIMAVDGGTDDADIMAVDGVVMVIGPATMTALF